MTLDENQKKRIAQWIEEGLKLSEIQGRLASEWGLKLTYMEVRFLVDDLHLTPKDPEPSERAAELPSAPEPGTSAEQDDTPVADTAGGPTKKGVSVSVDTLMKPGALVSGKVTFSDGNSADWYLDQMGRLGLVPKTEGYRPSPADLQDFQTALEREITRAGL